MITSFGCGGELNAYCHLATLNCVGGLAGFKCKRLWKEYRRTVSKLHPSIIAFWDPLSQTVVWKKWVCGCCCYCTVTVLVCHQFWLHTSFKKMSQKRSKSNTVWSLSYFRMVEQWLSKAAPIIHSKKPCLSVLWKEAWKQNISPAFATTRQLAAKVKTGVCRGGIAQKIH